MDYTVHGILQARILEWVAYPFSRRSSPTQGSNPGLPHCRQIIYQLSHKGTPRILEWIAYPFSSRYSQPRNRTRVSWITGRFFTNWAIRAPLSVERKILKWIDPWKMFSANELSLIHGLHIRVHYHSGCHIIPGSWTSTGTRSHSRRWAVGEQAKLHLNLQSLLLARITAWAPPPNRSVRAVDSHRSANPTVNCTCEGSRLHFLRESSWNHRPPWSVEKFSSMKLVPGAKELDTTL